MKRREQNAWRDHLVANGEALPETGEHKALRRNIERDEQIRFIANTAAIPVREGGVLRHYVLMVPNATWLSYLAASDKSAMFRALGSLRKQGFRSGAADLLIPLPRSRFSCLWLEFKKPAHCFKSARAAERAVSDEQRQFADDMQRAGGLWWAVYGCEHALEVTHRYLKGIATPG